MGNYAYLSLDKVKTDFGLTATTHDAALRRHLETVSEQIDRFCGRTFRTYLATHYYKASRSDRLRLDDDLLAVTTLKTLTLNSGGTRTYGDTWATTDYDLWPDNAASRRQPYTEIRRNPQGDYSFPSDARGVEIVGRWGYWQELEDTTSLLNGALTSSATSVTVDDGGDFDVLDTLLVDAEQMYVTAISTNTLTVVRGVNGTTAAAHSDNAVVERYRYPDEIATACGIQAARLFNRSRNSPTGVSGSPEVGVIRPVRLDADVRALIEPYRNLGA